MDTIIKTQALTKNYGIKTVVNNVSLTLNKGDIYGLIGSNGAGKTTFIRMVMGLATPTSGQIELFGSKENMVKNRERIGCIVETPSLLLNATATESLKAQALLYGADSAKIPQLLQLVGLADTGSKRVKDFSLGMKQRLALAQALINDADLLILDEPINGMDPQGIIEVRHLLLKLKNEHGKSILISSHILTELQQLCTRYGIINNGFLIDEFTSEELQEKNISSIIIGVNDIKTSLDLINQAYTREDFEVVAPYTICIKNEHNFTEINRLLVKNDIDVTIVEKSGGSLEKYFVDRIGQ